MTLTEFLIDIGILEKKRFVNDKCLVCGKELVQRQLRFCSPRCCSYYHNVTTKFKEIRNEKK
jgi:hypothetical protein